jgi:hypothetical protein
MSDDAPPLVYEGLDPIPQEKPVSERYPTPSRKPCSGSAMPSRRGASRACR